MYTIICTVDTVDVKLWTRKYDSNTKLIRKVLRLLPQRFSMKVTAIERANDVTTMKLDEPFGSLTTFELNLGDGDLITCRNTSYYSLLGRIMRPKHIVKVPKRISYVENL